MRIDQIDKNFEIKSQITEPDLVWYPIDEAPFSIHGVLYDESCGRYLRIPNDVAKSVSQGVSQGNTWTTGGRVRFKTNSSYIAITAKIQQPWFISQMSRAGMSGFDIYRDLDGKQTYFRTFLPPESWEDGYAGGTRTYGELTDYTIYFPQYSGFEKLFIGLKKDAILEAAEPYENTLPIVYYGSSITCGGCASRPGNNYPAFLSRRLNTDYINLGFSGNAKGEHEMAQYISDLKMKLLVIEYDSNAPSVEWLENTHYPFFKTIREANPDLPIVMISHCAALHAVSYEMNGGGWGSFDDRRAVIKNTYLRAKADGDENVYFVDGREIFKGDEWDAVTVEGVHPNDFGFMRFAQYLEKILKPLM